MDSKYKNIEIQLSSQPANTPIPFEVGDQPHTEICDYMEDCNNTCTGNGGNEGSGSGINGVDKTSITSISNDTYNSYFIQMNNSRIMERIRELFREQIPPEFETKTKTELKEKLKKALNTEGVSMKLSDIISSRHHFYTRKALIRHINIIKEYPIEQIYYALTSFINNKYEYLTDSYGRVGNLVNKGEIYMFRPIEINDEQSSVLDSSVPVNYKRVSFRLEVQTGKTNEFNNDSEPRLEKLDGDSAVESDKKMVNVKMQDYQNIINDIINNLVIARDSSHVLKSGEKNWYKNASKVMAELESFIMPFESNESNESTKQLSRSNIERHIVFHNLDMLVFRDKMTLLKNLFLKVEPNDEIVMGNEEIQWTGDDTGNDTVSRPTQTSVEQIIKQYFNKRKLTSPTKPEYGICIGHEKEYKIYMKPDNESRTEDTDSVELANLSDWKEADLEYYNLFSNDLKSKFVIKDKNATINGFIGFINIFKNIEPVFKVKDVTQSRNNTGARCDSAGKIDAIKNLNKIIGREMYTEANTKNVIHQNGLCVMLEIIMREYSDKKIKNSVYFLGPELAIINDIVKYSRPGK